MVCQEHNTIDRTADTSTFLVDLHNLVWFIWLQRLVCCSNFLLLEDKTAYDKTDLGGKKRRRPEDCNISAMLCCSKMT